MRKFTILLLLFLVPFWMRAAESINPTITPALFQHNTQITVVYDVTGTPLANLTNAYAWVWIPGVNINALYNINPASLNPGLSNNAKFTKSIDNGRTLFTLVFTPSSFFGSSIASQTNMGILLKGNDWADGQTTDYISTFWDGSYQLLITSPSTQPLFVSTNETISIEAQAPVLSDFELFINDVSVTTQLSSVTFDYDHVVSETAGYSVVRLVATAGVDSDESTFQYLISAASPVQARPPGIIPGINYNSSDDTRVTLCLWAPGKSSSFAFGDFSQWLVLPENLMKRDGEYFWLELSGLTPQEEYAFQYLVDEALKLADPYADKILDRDDQYIPEETYPNLKPYPAEAISPEWYFNRLSVFQTGQLPYDWQVTDFEKPEKKSLVIYELLLRDFFANGERNYQNLIDTISYFKRLGINAIELMPVMEFNGNEGWGYNPTFMFAPDKYYGTKNKLKEFIDVCHQNGIAVVFDIAMNHHDLPNPYVLMDFDFGTGKPTANNKWFNTDATHPFNVFFDMNHESQYTKQYLDTVNHYWLNEYKIDGFRFDLSKGFTQVNNPNDVGAWSGYDASRIAILKRMADEIWEYSPDAYVILEHLGTSTEEKALAEHRYNEGKGMLLWGNLNFSYRQIAAGYESDISSVYYKNRDWEAPHLVGYMESHDEERMMHTNLTTGNSSGGYNIRNLNTALNRVKAASTLFFTVPGPKMIWQFGELGFDYSINYCTNGTISNDCRLDPKPIVWNYQEVSERKALFNHIADLIRLRKEYDIFSTDNLLMTSGNSLVKQILLRNVPYNSSPTTADDMNAVVVANFGVTVSSSNVSFAHAGIWYDYYAHGQEVNLATSILNLSLAPGEFKLFTDVEIVNGIVTGFESENEVSISVFPNPVSEILNIETDLNIIQASIITLTGQVRRPIERISITSWSLRDVPSGFYVVEFATPSGVFRHKIIKH